MFFYFQFFFTSTNFFTCNCSFTSSFIFNFHKPFFTSNIFVYFHKPFFTLICGTYISAIFYPKFTTLLRFSCHPIFPNVGIYSKHFGRKLKFSTNAPPPKITVSPTQWPNTHTHKKSFKRLPTH